MNNSESSRDTLDLCERCFKTHDCLGSHLKYQKANVAFSNGRTQTLKEVKKKIEERIKELRDKQTLSRTHSYVIEHKQDELLYLLVEVEKL